MSLFGTGSTGSNVEKEQDFSKRLLDTDVYPGTLKIAFVGQATSGARFVTVQAKLDNGKDYSETVYISNKEGKNTYVKDGKEYYMPGFLLINNLAIMTVGKGLFDLEADVETRAVKLYDFDAKKEVLTDVPAIIPMTGKRVLLAIQAEEYEKTKLNDASRQYEGTGEYGTKNQMVKVYNPETRQTAVEMRDDKPAEQLDSWLASYKGKVKEAQKTAAPVGMKTATAGTPSGLF